MRYRIYMRTLKFIAFYWSLPFLVGAVFAMVILTWGQLDFLEGFDKVHTDSIKAVVAACAQ